MTTIKGLRNFNKIGKTLCTQVFMIILSFFIVINYINEVSLDFSLNSQHDHSNHSTDSKKSGPLKTSEAQETFEEFEQEVFLDHTLLPEMEDLVCILKRNHYHFLIQPLHPGHESRQVKPPKQA